MQSSDVPWRNRDSEIYARLPITVCCLPNLTITAHTFSNTLGILEKLEQILAKLGMSSNSKILVSYGQTSEISNKI